MAELKLLFVIYGIILLSFGVGLFNFCVERGITITVCEAALLIAIASIPILIFMVDI